MALSFGPTPMHRRHLPDSEKIGVVGRFSSDRTGSITQIDIPLHRHLPATDKRQRYATGEIRPFTAALSHFRDPDDQRGHKDAEVSSGLGSWGAYDATPHGPARACTKAQLSVVGGIQR